MTDTPRRSLRKRVANNISQKIEHLFAGSKQSVPPNIPQGSTQQHETARLERMTQDESTTHHSSSKVPTATANNGTLSNTSAQAAKCLSKGALGILSSTSSGIPVPGVKAIFDSIIKVIDVIEVTQANREGFKALESHCQTLIDKVIGPLKGKLLLEIPAPLIDSLNELECNLTTIVADIENKLQLSKVNQVINHEEHGVIIKKMNDQISHFLEHYSANINTWAAIKVHEAHQTHVKIYLEQKLMHASAGFDHRSVQARCSCLAGTRELLLTDIKSWIHDLSMNKPIYVLYGIAGVGKTTVAQTVAEYASKTGMLLGSFFFSRAEDQCNSGDQFFSTLAFQFACYHGDLASQVAEILKAVPDISYKTFDLQFQWLIVDPIQKAKISQTPLVLVIDALDECLAADARTILELLAKHVQSMPNVKIFITTRPESHIQRLLELKGPIQPFYLGLWAIADAWHIRVLLM